MKLAKHAENKQQQPHTERNVSSYELQMNNLFCLICIDRTLNDLDDVDDRPFCWSRKKEKNNELIVYSMKYNSSVARFSILFLLLFLYSLRVLFYLKTHT